ncbi:MAG: type II secretion system protein [Janthinobacterium lividum]
MAPLRRSTGSRAFTLIELLVVIAIIAILTAILLPVFATVRENSRQSVSISNLKDIQQKMEQFKLDNHRYPDVLFGYSDGNGNMKGALGRAQAAGNTSAGIPIASLYFPGLYPAYIKDVEEFTDPNNNVNTSDSKSTPSPLAVNLIAPCNAPNDEILSTGTTTPATSSPCSSTTTYPSGSVVPTTRGFYLADAYDSNPVATGTNAVSATSVVRYQTAREATVANGTTGDADYNYQLRWQNPPAGSLITATTYHVQNADKVIVMFESGAVKKITGEDFAALEGTSTTPTFWKVNSWPTNIQP